MEDHRSAVNPRRSPYITTYEISSRHVLLLDLSSKIIVHLRACLILILVLVFGKMGRGVSSGGGQSSLGYLFGSGEAPKSPPPTETEAPVQKPATPSVDKQIPAGIQGNNVNNYFRAEGQNTGNFITDRPSTKVHAAPGGGSSLGYLFGGGGN